MICPSPCYIASSAFDQTELINLATTFVPQTPHTHFAAAWGTTADHQHHILIAQEHMTIGYRAGSRADHLEIAQTDTGKYTFKSEPVNRLMMAAARMGIKLDQRLLVTSRVPTSREMVNMVTANMVNLYIIHPNLSRDVESMTGLFQLQKAGIIQVT